MTRSIKRRMALVAASVGTVGSAATLLAGVTFGFFSATTPTQSNTFSAGTVSLGHSAETSCTVSNVQPGDSGTCGFTVTYTGTVSGGAWLAADLAVTSPVAGSPETPYVAGNLGAAPTAADGLYDSSTSGLQVTVTDNQLPSVTYMSGTSWNGGTATSGTTPSISDLLVNNAPITNGTSVTFSVAWSMPSSADNAYDGAASTFTIFIHAVQAANDGNATSVAACTEGDTCAAIPSWS